MGALGVATLAALKPAVAEMERAADAVSEDEASQGPSQGADVELSPEKRRRVTNAASDAETDDQQAADDDGPRGRDTRGRSDGGNVMAEGETQQ